jgi:hypothetical protein
MPSCEPLRSPGPAVRAKSIARSPGCGPQKGPGNASPASSNALSAATGDRQMGGFVGARPREAFGAEFLGANGFLDTATYGVPPRFVAEALRALCAVVGAGWAGGQRSRRANARQSSGMCG